MFRTAQDLIEREEGFRAETYLCSENYPTIGIGTRIGPQMPEGFSVETWLAPYEMKWTKETARFHLSNKIEGINKELSRRGIYHTNTLRVSPRDCIILSLAYQVGVSGAEKFRKMFSAIDVDDWALASSEYMDSKAARQTPERFGRGAEVLLSNSFDVYNN